MENIEVKVGDEEKVILLLRSLPVSFKHFKDVLLYGKNGIITLDEFQTTVRSKEMQRLEI